jgi:predicted deacetylase
VLPTEAPALCVSIHDVAPATWPQCRRLLQLVRSVADIPTSVLVVPAYHGRRARAELFDKSLEKLLEQGHELVLHGYTHQDSGPPPRGPLERFLRHAFSRHEAEFSAIGAAEMEHRLKLGRAWFEQRRWPLHGFVAPAWLLAPCGWRVLAALEFEYTTTAWQFHLLHPHLRRRAPNLVFAARNLPGRIASRWWTGMLARLLEPAPLVRLSLHPPDAEHPDLMRQAARLLEALLQTREPLTKHAFAQRWREDWGCGAEPGQRLW